MGKTEGGVVEKYYRTKLKVIEAIMFDGENFKECKKFIDDKYDNTLNFPNIITKIGVFGVVKGDYIIKRTNGEIDLCKPDVFEKVFKEIS